MTSQQADVDAWLLLDDKPGHESQVVGLAKKLGMTGERKRLTFNFLNHLPNPILGAQLMSLDRASAVGLVAPWPRTVIGMGRRIVPVARWIAKQNNGNTRVIFLGRKVNVNAQADEFLISSSHFNHVKTANMIELSVPPTKVDSFVLAEARRSTPSPFQELKRPHHLLLIGGPTALHKFGTEEALVLARRIVGAVDGSLAILSSPRTPLEVITVLQRELSSAKFHIWQRNQKQNPYLSYLAHADTITVTGESETMIAEAVATGLPLTIYPLPMKPMTFKSMVLGRFRHIADRQDMWGKFFHGLFAKGWVTPPRQLERMHKALVQAGQATIFDGALNSVPPPHANDEKLLELLIKS